MQLTHEFFGSDTDTIVGLANVARLGVETFLSIGDPDEIERYSEQFKFNIPHIRHLRNIDIHGTRIGILVMNQIVWKWPLQIYRMDVRGDAFRMI
jgi:hypothetical protein